MTRQVHRIMAVVAAVGLWLGNESTSQAHFDITSNPSDLQSGITYEWKAVAHHPGEGHFSGSVGAKSWAEPGNPVGAKGWTHTSDWVAVDLSGLSEPHLFTVQLDRGSTGALYPAFTLYDGWETVNSDATNHTYNNTGNITWATNLTYHDHRANGGGPNGTANGTGLTSVSGSWVLNPGLYTLVFGGNPPYDLGQTGVHDFHATLTLSELSTVPLPPAVWLFGTGVAAMVALARRRNEA